MAFGWQRLSCGILHLITWDKHEIAYRKKRWERVKNDRQKILEQSNTDGLLLWLALLAVPGDEQNHCEHQAIHKHLSLTLCFTPSTPTHWNTVASFKTAGEECKRIIYNSQWQLFFMSHTARSGQDILNHFRWDKDLKASSHSRISHQASPCP